MASDQKEKIVVRRSYAAAPAKVFAAWTDAAQLARWYMPEDGWVAAVHELDVRAGGRYRVSFGPAEEPSRYVEDGEYLEVEPARKLVFIERVSQGGRLLSEGLTTVEFIDTRGSTEIVLTSEGAGVASHEEGWGSALRHLAEMLSG